MIIDGFKFESIDERYHLSINEGAAGAHPAWHAVFTMAEIAKLIKGLSQDLRTGESLKLKIWRAD